MRDNVEAEAAAVTMDIPQKRWPWRPRLGDRTATLRVRPWLVFFSWMRAVVFQVSLHGIASYEQRQRRRTEIGDILIEF
jgi:hypothetical protein